MKEEAKYYRTSTEQVEAAVENLRHVLVKVGSKYIFLLFSSLINLESRELLHTKTSEHKTDEGSWSSMVMMKVLSIIL